MSAINIRVDETENTSNNRETSGRLSSRSSDSDKPSGIATVDSAKLAENMATLRAQLDEIFTDVETVGKFKLKKIELGIEISGEGGINLIGTVKVKGKGAITLTFEPGS